MLLPVASAQLYDLFYMKFDAGDDCRLPHYLSQVAEIAIHELLRLWPVDRPPYSCQKLAEGFELIEIGVLRRRGKEGAIFFLELIKLCVVVYKENLEAKMQRLLRQKPV
jgi:hypothetical protein